MKGTEKLNEISKQYNELKIRTIGNIIQTKPEFEILDYQRGYKWTKEQVQDLLNDFETFFEKYKNTNNKYCLQPIIVKNKENSKTEVVDGQQRLTTINLIMRNLQKENKGVFKFFYETRSEFNLTDNEGHLIEISQENATKNINYYYLYNADQTIKEWIQQKGPDFNKKEMATNIQEKVEVIWYNIKEEEEPMEVFTRVNAGKIPLTEAELIKAIFLKRKEKEETLQRYQYEISTEWDMIEYELNEDEFWYFLTNIKKEKYDTKIDLLFELFINREKTSQKQLIKKEKEHYIFNYFYERIKQEKAEEIWKEVKDFYFTIKEWYLQNKYKYLVGYLIHINDKNAKRENIEKSYILEIDKKYSESKGKIEFEEKLKTTIREQIENMYNKEETNKEETQNDKEIDIKTINYNHDNDLILSILLLFNIATSIQTSNQNEKFSFAKYKQEEWDIKHIKSVNPNKVEKDSKKNIQQNKKELQQWLENKIKNLAKIENYEENQDVKEKIGEIIEENEKSLNLVKNYKKETIEEESEIYENIIKNYIKANNLFGEDITEEEIHHIGNLVILNRKINRAYHNEIFPIKRETIINKDKKGIYILTCTKNVFLKYYSPNIFNKAWKKEDLESYTDEIVKCINTNITKIFKEEKEEGKGKVNE